MANSIIPNQSYFSDFRQRCEDKNTLKNKGDLYMGTGEKITSTSSTETAPIEGDIYKTDVLLAPDEANNIIVSKGKNNQNIQQGVEYKNIVDAVNAALTANISKNVSRSELSNKISISGYSSASSVSIQVVSALPSQPDSSVIYIII